MKIKINATNYLFPLISNESSILELEKNLLTIVSDEKSFRDKLKHMREISQRGLTELI